MAKTKRKRRQVVPLTDQIPAFLERVGVSPRKRPEMRRLLEEFEGKGDAWDAVALREWVLRYESFLESMGVPGDQSDELKTLLSEFDASRTEKTRVLREWILASYHGD